MAVAQNAYVVSWFKGTELNMVFGLLLSVSRIVSADTYACVCLCVCACACVRACVCVCCKHTVLCLGEYCEHEHSVTNL